MRLLTVLLCLWPLWSSSVGTSRADEVSADEAPLLFVQLPVDRELESRATTSGGMLRAAYGEGGRIVRFAAAGKVEVLTCEFHSACEFDLSFDAQRMLFAGKRQAEDPWNIFEMALADGSVRQVTRDFGQCRQPAYQSTLYTIISDEPWFQMMFASDVAGVMNEYGSGRTRSLYSCRLDGSELRRLTMNLSDDMDPSMLNDGRVVYAAWQRMDLSRGHLGRVSLFTVQPDGADGLLFSGDAGRRVKQMACETASGLVVFIEADRVGWDGAGALASVTMKRNLHSYRPITEPGEGLYHSPSPLPDGRVLVSRRPVDGSGSHGIVRLDPDRGAIETVYDDPAFHDFHARQQIARPKPDGRSSVVSEKFLTGRFYCLNAYIADRDVQRHLKPPEIRQVRVIEGVPYRAHGQESAGSRNMPQIVQKRLLGIAPVHEDGSFHIELPADVPVQLQTLDGDGMALQTCGWTWVKHHEPRGCVGCHEDPELAPENRFVDALKVAEVKLTLPPERRRTVDFRRDLMPIIAQRCEGCHGGDSAPVKLTDEPADGFNMAYKTLMTGVDGEQIDDQPVTGRYVHPGQARTSPLIWHLHGRNTSRAWDDTYDPSKDVRQMPPDAPLSEWEKRTFVEWIDLGAHWNGIPCRDCHSDQSTKPSE